MILASRMVYLSIFLFAASLAALLLYGLLRTGLAWRIATDLPNHRSLHDRPIPRVGGWGIVFATAMVGVLWVSALDFVLLAAVFLAAVSFADDRIGLSAAVRFPAHWLAAGVVIAWSAAGQPGWFLFCAALVTVWMTNLFNFMDGSNGLAGGMALFGFSGYAWLAGLAGDGDLALFSLGIAGASLGFLFFNFGRARVFMGDAGSIPLGFLSGALGWLGYVRDVWAWWLPLFLFSPFVLDASVTLLRRLLRGEKIWQAHREHYYQRLVRMGLGHRNTALLYYAVMLGVTLSAAFMAGQPDRLRWSLLFAWLLVFAVAGGKVDHAWRRFVEREAA